MASPLLSAIKAYHCKVLVWRIFYVCLSVIFVVSLFYVDPVYRLMCALARISAIQVSDQSEYLLFCDNENSGSL